MTDASLTYDQWEQLIEDIIRKDIELDPAQSRIKNMGENIAMWGFTRGSAMVFTVLTKGKSSNYIQVFSPIIKLNTGAVSQELYLKLLKLNATPELCSAAFAIKESNVVLKSDRTTTGLSRLELLEMIIRVGRLADKYDDQLLEEFGGEMSD